MSKADDDLAVAEASLLQFEAAAAMVRADIQRLKEMRGQRTARELTDDERTVLRQHADHFQQMATFVHGLDVRSATALLHACRAANQNNCDWASLKAAKFLEEEIAILMMVERRK